MPAQFVDPIPGQTRAAGGVVGGGAMAPPLSDFNSENGAMALKRSSSPTMDLKKIFLRAMRKSSVKTLFKSKRTRPKTPADLVRYTTLLLSNLDSPVVVSGTKHAEKIAELDMLIREMKLILYGNGECEPVAEACAQLTQEFFKENTLRSLVLGLPKLNLEARKDATRVVANLQRQPVNSRLIASDYLESNLDLMELLISGYEDPVIALHYGGMLRECIRHQVVARYVLKSECMKKFFDYIQLPNFDVAADATATFKELMTRHKSTVAEFLSENYTWFFAEFNSKLLESPNYITRRQAIKLLGDMLLDRSNSAIMVRYVRSKDNLRILMNLLRETSKCIQFDAFHVFKLFVANQNKPPDIINILVANRSKLLRFLSSFKTDKEDGSFEADKAQVVIEITELEPTTVLLLGSSSGDLNKIASCGDIKKIAAYSGQELDKPETKKTASCGELEEICSSSSFEESNKL